MTALTPWAEKAAMVGRYVTVVLNDGPPPVEVTGTLLGLEPDGDFTIDLGGEVRYGWPALSIRPAEPEASRE